MAGLDFQRRAARRVLEKHGKTATLRGDPAGKVAITQYVEEAAGVIDTAHDNPMANVLLATIDSAYAPRTGDTVVHPDGTYKLVRRHLNNGHVEQFVVAKVA